MAYVPIPKDLTNVKTKMMFNLTTRQIVCFSLAGLVGVPTFMLTYDILGNELAVLLVMILAAPFIFFAMFERDGLTGEKYLKQMLEFKFKRSAIRRYKNRNFYEIVHDMTVLEDQFEKQLTLKETEQRKKQTKSIFKSREA